MTIVTAYSHSLTLPAATITLTIILICLLTSSQIMRRYRNKQVFLYLMSGFTLASMPHLLNLFKARELIELATSFYITSTIAHMISFIIINFVFMKMYATGIRINKTPILFIACGAIAAIAASIVVPPYTVADLAAPAYPILDFYMFVLIGTMLVVTRHLEMPSAFFISLTVMFSYQVAHMLHQYVFEHAQAWLVTFMHISPILYYGLLFYLLLEWIMERLLITYRTAISDGLTGLYVRRYFEKKLAAMLDRKPVAVIFCDIDNFKLLNDTKGHHTADQALQQVALIIKEEVEPLGIAGRYGGEELLAAIEIDKKKPQAIAERIRARVEQESIVTISVGYCTTKESTELSSLIKLADTAMYYSKSTGKNRVTGYRASMTK